MPFSFLLLIDHAHMDNGMMLRSMADKIAASKGQRGLILHADSAYTDRIMQTGVPREQAQIRSLKDLNNRLIALLADSGCAAVGLHGHQKELLSTKNGNLQINTTLLESLPAGVHVVLNHLGWNSDTQVTEVLNYSEVATALALSLHIPKILGFIPHEHSSIVISQKPFSCIPSSVKNEEIHNLIPESLKKLPLEVTFLHVHQLQP